MREVIRLNWASLRLRDGRRRDAAILQSCVNTFLLSSENHPQNVPLPTPKMHYDTTFQQAIPQNLAGLFLYFSVLGNGSEKSNPVGSLCSIRSIWPPVWLAVRRCCIFFLPLLFPSKIPSWSALTPDGLDTHIRSLYRLSTCELNSHGDESRALSRDRLTSTKHNLREDSMIILSLTAFGLGLRL